MPQVHAPIIPAIAPPRSKVTTVDTRFCFEGVVGDWLATIVDNWLLAFLSEVPTRLALAYCTEYCPIADAQAFSRL